MNVACWLMGRFGVSAPLQGDLIEARRRHGSVWWLSRQVVAAILHSVILRVHDHAFRTAAIAATSTVALLVWLDATRALFIRVTNGAFGFIDLRGSHFLFIAWVAYGGPLYPAWLLGSFLEGWVIARHARAATTLLVVLVELPCLLWFSLPYWRMIFVPIGQTAFTMPLTWTTLVYRVGFWLAALVPVLGVPAATLIGGLVGAPQLAADGR